MSPNSKDKKTKTDKKSKLEPNNYIVPRNKKQLIQYINQAGVEDIICTSSILDGQVTFGLEIRTKDKKSFNFGQNLFFKPVLEPVEILDMSTGDCAELDVNLGKEFDPKTYDYQLPPAWSFAKCE